MFSQNETDRVSLIFGRNGSGKSTISIAVSKATGNEEAANQIKVDNDDKKMAYRLLEERTKSLTDNDFFATITTDEKKRTAKDDVGVDVIENIEKWLNAIAISQGSEVSA